MMQVLGFLRQTLTDILVEIFVSTVLHYTLGITILLQHLPRCLMVDFYPLHTDFSNPIFLQAQVA